MNNKDEFLLKKIVMYCHQLDGTRELFGDTPEKFAGGYVYQNACCMCIIQIGELAGKLSEDVRKEIPMIPWTAIRGMRNMFAHDYGSMDIERTWATISKDIPELCSACERYLEKKEQK